MLGQTVGKYQVVSRLGRGGMGTVYKAVDETLKREVAIKSLNRDLSDPEPLKRFRAEAITLAKLNHPNIAMVFELTEHEGELLMVMEFVRGETFEALSQRSGPLPLDRCRELCTQVLDALEHAHACGVVHRDLKPANLMLTESGVVKVMDFGLARMAGAEHLTNDGFMVGTPAYMAPEQVLAKEIDGRADLYAMGVVLYRLLTAQLPFKADSGVAMAHMQVHDTPTPLRTRRTELSAECETIISRALAKAPADRFQSAAEFKRALASLDIVDANLTIAAPTPPPTLSSVSAPSPAVKPVSPAPSAADQPTVGEKTSARKVQLAGIFAAVLFAGVLTTAFPVWRSRGEPQKASPALAAPPLAAAAAPASVAATPPASVTATPTASVAATPTASVTAAPPASVTARAPASVAATAPASAARASASKTLTFSRIKLLQIDDEKTPNRDVSVTLRADTLDVLDGKTLVARALYHDIVGLHQSHSREPRYTTPAGTTASLAKVGGRFGFLKGAQDWVSKGATDWISVQTRTAFISLNVPESELAPLASELESRTGARVVLTR